MSESAERIRLLHVDHTTSFTAATKAYLEQETTDITIRQASSASDGLSILAEEDVDCVVSDYDMERKDGIEFLETIREEYPDLPFILFTGKGSEEVASEAISAGVTDYLQKKMGSEQYKLLANRVRNAVEQYRATKRAARQDRINTVVRDINEALARAATKREIDRAVCDVIADADPYRFAWVGERHPESATIQPRAAAGVGDDYLEAIEVTVDDSATAEGPTGRAVKQRELSVMQDIPNNPQYEPWRAQAIQRDFRSSAAVPLEYDGTLYGVLNVYAGRTGAFDEHERRLLSDLGETIAHAHHRIELQQQFADQYRTLFEEAPVMVVFTRAEDGDPIIEDCNQAFADRLGYARDKLVETPLEAYYTESAREALFSEEGYERALSGTFVRQQRTLETRTGEEVLTVLRASPRRNRHGEIIGTHALFVDITEEQQIEELERTNAVLSTLFDGLPQGIIAEDESRNVLAVNERIYDLLDLPGNPEADVGADCEKLARAVSDVFANPAGFVDGIEDVIQRGEPVDAETLHLDDGRIFERSYRPIELPDGDGHLWIYADSTERIEYRKRIEELQYRTQQLISLKEEAAIARETVAIAEETLGFPLAGVHLVDDERRRLEPVATTAAVREHIGEEPVYVRGDDAAPTDRYNWKVFESGEPEVIENVHDHEDISADDTPSRSGIIYPLGDHGVLITSSPDVEAFDQTDVHLLEILATIVTAMLDRAAHEGKLREQTRQYKAKTERLDEFASVISHDLRNPLNVASTRLELLADDAESEHIAHIERAHDRMEALIADLLTLAREGSRPTDREEVPLAALVEESWETVETSDGTLDLSVSQTVEADRSRLRQVFENLIHNAIQYGGEDVTVTVGDLPDGMYVEDDGPGIPPEDRQRVFDAGYSTGRSGTGFGLSIVKQVLSAHGWQISITEGEAGGTRFEITGFGSE